MNKDDQNESVEFVDQLREVFAVKKEIKPQASVDGDEMPLSAWAVAAAAKQQSISVSEFIANERARLARVPYPTDECFSVAELESLAAGKELPEPRMGHLADCSYCIGAIAACRAASDAAAVETAWARLRPIIQRSLATAASRPSTTESETQSKAEIFDHSAIVRATSTLPPPPFLRMSDG